MSKIRIAIQNKGRLQDASWDFLRSIGLKFAKNGRELIVSCDGSDVELLYVRNGDIPVYVSQNVADFGIVGENVLIERGSNLKIVEKLGFGKCRLIIAAPNGSNIKSLRDLEGERIATSYPNTLKSFLVGNEVNASIIDIRGSVEIAPSLNLADSICDITQTGNSLKENGLNEICQLFQSEAVVVKCPMNSQLKWNDFKKLLTKNYEKVLFAKTS